MRRGQTIADRFVIERLAGAGGMGSVYRAHDLARDVPVALKVLAEASTHDLRFAREAELLASLSHPHIVRYVAHGATPSGLRYLAMEWLEGHDLAARLRDRGLRLRDGVRLAAAAARALGYAHARGVVHRDVKPGNLFLVGGDPGAVRVIDFGIARAPWLSGATRTGAVLGTPGYLAPEQARGAAEVGPAADVFALGCVLFELLTGRPPFVGEHAVAVLAKILAEDAPPAHDLSPEAPPELDDLLARMLAKDPARRPPDGDAVADELDALDALDLRPSVVARPPPTPSITAREQQLVSVILVAQDTGGDDAAEAPTVVTGDLEARFESVRAAAAPFDAAVEPLAGGGALVTLARAGVATDHAARAARCALAVRRARPDVAVVLATGRATLADRLPVGAVIDRAAERIRRLRAAGDASLVVDEVTAGLLDARFELRGAREPEGFELVGERDATPSARTLLGRPTVFAGRERELSILVGAWEACVAAPAAQAVLVTAPPGAGKSRLRQEFLRRLEARGEATTAWVAAPDPLGARSPFGVLARCARAAAGIDDGDRPELRRQKLHARLARHLGGAALARAAAFLGELVGTAPDDSAELRAARRDADLMGAQLRAAFTAWLDAESAAAPVALVLEDLHRADPASVRAVESALAALAERPVMLLALARPEVRDELPGAFESVGALSLALGPLTPRACERIARDALGADADADAVARAVARSEGNALYLEELVRALAEGRGEALPETVLAMVAARLDRLDAHARRVLRAASVFGQEFDERGVLALLGGGDRTTQVGDRLRRLVDAEVLSRRGNGYAFRHALLRDASYALLTEGDRALGHRLAAEHLLARGEDDAAVLAEHLARSDRPSLAAPWCRRAAERSLHGGALDDALAWSRRAREAGADGEELGAALRVEARARSLRGENATAAACGEAALALLPRGGAAWHDAAADLATTSLRAGDRARLAALARALLDARAPDDVAAASRAVALARAAIHLAQAGLDGEAAALRDALRGAPDAGADDPAARAWRLRLDAVEALRAGDPAAYLALSRDVAAAFDEAGDRVSAASQRGNVGYAYLELGAWALAVEALRGALTEATALRAHSVAGLVRHNLGFALAMEGDVASGAALEREAAEGFAAQGDRRLEGFAHAYLARIEALAGDLPAAVRGARHAAELAAEVPPLRAYALATLADALLAGGDTDAARDAAREAEALRSTLGRVEDGEALIRLADVETRAATGDAAGARTALVEAARRLHERASRVSDETLRATFLQAIPENARTLALAAAWQIDVESPAG
ncbi:MAG: protein kinase [Polyangiales bacterium]